MIGKYIKLSIILTFSFLFVLLQFNDSFTQDKSNVRKFGLASAIQDNQLDIVMPIWFAQKTVVAPALSVLWVEDGGTDLGLGLVLRFYGNIKKVTPYFGGRFGAMLLSLEDQDTVVDYFAGVLFGGEFFLHPQFSIGIEAQANATFSDDESIRFGNPGGVNINTATVIIANIYF